MIPILYKSDEVDFYDNGLGPLNDIYDVDVQEQRNGLFTLTASYPVSGRRYKDIEVGRIVLAKPNQNDRAQAFRIIHTELDISGYALTIEADHITYDLTHNLVKSIHLQGNGQNAMTHLQEATVSPHLFRFISDLQHEGDSTLTMVNPMEAIAGTQGSILQIWGGELKRDNRTVSMLSRRGRNNFTSFRLGKNINGLKYTVDTANLVTRIVPSVQRPNGNENELIIGNIVDSKNVGNYPNYYMQHVDVADNIKIDENDSDDVIKGKINAYAKNWFTQSANSKIDLPEVTVEIDVTSLQDSADYQDKFKNIEAIELTDSVTVYVPEFGVNVQAVVNELHYDPVAERVTSIVIGTSKLSFADANSNTLKELGSSINKIRENAVTAIVSANGKNTNYYDTEEPAHPVEGDLWFKSVGDETYLMIFKDGRWQEWVSTKTQDIINKAVDDALASAKEYTDELNEKQAKDVADFKELVDTSLADAQKDRDELSQKADDMLTTANKYSDDIYSKAVANAKEQATGALSSANSSLSEAKSDLTTAINQEISDRNKAVQTVNSQAQDYADQAKADAIEAANTADGQVRKDFKVTTDALSSTISQNKQDSDGKISTAQSTATQALDGLSTKVSQTDYDKKTGDLSTKVNTVTQTATETKDELANISKTVDSQSAKINTISNTVDGTTQTVSDIQTEQGKQSGSINKLETRADGFDASITKINDFVNSQGQVNQLFNTEFTPDLEGWDSSDSHLSYVGINNSAVVKGSNVLNIMHDSTTSWSRYSQRINTFVPEGVLSASVQARAASGNWMFAIDSYNSAGTRTIIKQVTVTSANTLLKIENVTIPSDTVDLYYSFWSNTEGTIAIAQPMLVFSSTVGDYVQGNYNNNGALAKVKLTADKAALDLSTYKTNADGRISKAQSDITATANEVKTKVSQSDYNTKTNDLTTKYGQVKATADAVTTDVANYKKSNDSKVSANTANITANAKAIALKVSQTDFDFNSKDVNTKISNQQITVDKISQSVTELQAKANAQGQVNQLMNTEFTPDLQGWDKNNSDYINYVGINKNAVVNGSNVLNIQHSSTDGWGMFSQDIVNFPTAGTLSASIYARQTAGNWVFTIDSYDSSGTRTIIKTTNLTTTNTLIKFENVQIPDGTVTLKFSFRGQNAGTAVIAQPMLVFMKSIGDYVQGNYNNNSRVTALELDINGIHGLVDDPKKGLSSTWDLASNGQTLAVKAQQDATTAITTAKGLQTTVNDNKNDLQAQITATAKQVATEMTDRANGDKSVRTDMANLIDQRVSSLTTGYETAISQSADKVMASVSMPNKLLNTEFTPDLQGWSGNNFISYVAVNKSTKKMGSNVLNITHSADTGWGQYSQKISNFMVGGSVSASVYAREDSGEWAFTLDSYDATGKRTILRSVSVSTGYSLLKIENVEIPQDAVELRYSFWSQTVGMLLIAQPMLVFSDSVPIYMPGSYSGINTSTVLELFKDNWALGIADNSGKIISGINGDPSGTVIQGKKLVINPDTTINGKAFIDGAVIKNASIGTAQIGKAAIGSAQIIDVDVSKISGNIANFITANVNTLNARVLYGDTGHLGTTDTGLIINKQDDHLQLSSKGQYDVDTKRAQLELLNYADNIDANMQGSLNYYKNPHNNGTGLGIRLLGNQILAIDEAVATGNLYLSPYASGQVQVVNRDRNGFQDIKASKFVTSSERKYKSEINEFNDDALELVNGLNIRRYIKNSEDEIGVIADEADKRILDKTNTGVDLYSFVSVVAKAVQELSAQVKELQSERPNN